MLVMGGGDYVGGGKKTNKLQQHRTTHSRTAGLAAGVALIPFLYLFVLGGGGRGYCYTPVLAYL